MAPPSPPLRVDIRRTACRAQKNAPNTLTAKSRSIRSAVRSSTRLVGATIPALMTAAVRVPNSSAASKAAMTSASWDTSARTVLTRAPWSAQRAATASAAPCCSRYVRQTSYPRPARRIEVAAPIPRPPPVIRTTPDTGRAFHTEASSRSAVRTTRPGPARSPAPARTDRPPSRGP